MKQDGQWKIVAVFLCAGICASQVPQYEAEAVMTTSGTANVLTVRAVRAIPRALIRLAEEYGWTANFEEAPITYSGDLVDMTSPTYHSKGAEDRALDPRSIPLRVQFSTPRNSSSVEEASNVITRLLQAHSHADLPGKYRVRQYSDHIVQVVPYEVRDQQGNAVSVTPLMDQPVSFPEDRNRTALDTVRAVLDQVSAKTGATLLLGGIADNRLKATFPDRVDSQPAREVLDAIMLTLQIKCWTVLYDPGPRVHVLTFPVTNTRTKVATG